MGLADVAMAVPVAGSITVRLMRLIPDDCSGEGKWCDLRLDGCVGTLGTGGARAGRVA